MIGKRRGSINGEGRKEEGGFNGKGSVGKKEKEGIAKVKGKRSWGRKQGKRRRVDGGGRGWGITISCSRTHTNDNLVIFIWSYFHFVKSSPSPFFRPQGKFPRIPLSKDGRGDRKEKMGSPDYRNA